MFKQALRMTYRDWRAGELIFLMLALMIAVAAMSTVGFFVERLSAGLERDAHQLLGADLVLNADQPINPAWRVEAEQRGLKLADTVVFPSMALSGQGAAARSQLVSIKAVSSGYPLRGQVSVSATSREPAKPIAQIPAPGTVWVDPDLLSALQLNAGATLQLGEHTFRIAKVIALEPDRGSAFVNFAPRVMLALSDLPATQLLQDGSRVTYRLLLSGQAGPLAKFQDWLEAQIKLEHTKGVRIESVQSGRPEMQATLVRAHQFLSLVGLLSALLAAVAVAMAARRFVARHLDACSMLRCLGLSQNQVTRLYLYELLMLGLVASLVGVGLGFGAHFVLLDWLASLLGHQLPSASWWPALQGVAVGLLLLCGFALPPILQLRNVAHNRVLRRETQAPQAWAWITFVVGAGAFTGLLLWQAGDVRLGALTVAGFLGACIVFAVLAWLVLKALRPLRSLFSFPAWRFALTALQRRSGSSVVQIVALALGLMALLLLTVVRGDLIGAWRASTSPDAPNRFVINIQPEQAAAVSNLLQKDGVAPPRLYPMIRGRLVQINQRAVTGASYPDDRAQRLVNREFNLSTMSDLPAQNQIVAGHWFATNTGANTLAEASVEQGLAETLGLKLGDQITFDIAGQSVAARITSLRRLDWGSMQVNFFVIINPEAMRGMPQTLITAFHLTPAQRPVVNQLTQQFPNLTVVDIGNILLQIQTVLDQVVGAVEFLFMFTLIAGGLVLYAALIGSQDERVRESALLRALGATRRQLSRAQWIEFTLTGAVAGFLAASGAAATGWALAHFVFHFDWHFSPLVWLAGVAVGVLCSFLGGWLGLRRVLDQPPLQTLREAF